MKYKKFENEQRIYRKMRKSIGFRIFSIFFLLVASMVWLMIVFVPLAMIFESGEGYGLFVYLVILPVALLFGRMILSLAKESFFIS